MSDTRSLPLIPLEDGIVLPGDGLRVRARVSRRQRGGRRGRPRRPGRARARRSTAASRASASSPTWRASPSSCRAATAASRCGRCTAPSWVVPTRPAARSASTSPSGPTRPRSPSRSAEQMRAYRAVIESILEARDRGRVIAFLRSVEEPGALADTAGFSPDLSFRAEARAARDARRRRAAREGDRLGARRARRDRAEAAHPRRRHRGHGEEPARVPAAPPARRHPQGARRGRRVDEIARYRDAHRGDDAARGGPQGGRARVSTASRAGARRRRGLHHPHLPRLAAAVPWGKH